jgi:ferredoxin
MKIAVDAALCQGYGLCHDEAPALVELDEFGYAGILGDGTVAQAQHAAAESAVATCPAKALRLLEA